MLHHSLSSYESLHGGWGNFKAAGIIVGGMSSYESLHFRKWSPTFAAAGEATGIAAAAKILHPVVWKKPTGDWIKVNCDATFKKDGTGKGTCSVACVIRNSNGDALLVASCPAHHAADVNAAELEAVILGAEMILLYYPDKMNVWIETNNFDVVQSIPPIFVSEVRDHPTTTPYESRLIHLKNLLENRRVGRFSFAYRQANFPADKGMLKWKKLIIF
ncbi:hypothetical protein OROMI_031756 [Orobanche minor]